MFTTDATVPDVKATEPVQRRLAEHGVKPGEHYLDSGYPSADLITAALKQGTRMVTPVLLDHSAHSLVAPGRILLIDGTSQNRFATASASIPPNNASFARRI